MLAEVFSAWRGKEESGGAGFYTGTNAATNLESVKEKKEPEGKDVDALEVLQGYRANSKGRG